MPAMRTSIRRRPLLVLIATLGLHGCARSAPQSESGAITSSAATTASAGRFSVYDLDAQWRDQHGTTRTLGTLRGRPQLLAMVYTHCTSACPLSVSTMKDLEARTDPSVGLVLVTLDPANDTPARLLAYAVERGLSARWTLLSGSDEAVRELAAAIGVRYRRIDASELAHTNTLTVLDAAGAPVHQQTGLDGQGETLAVIHALDVAATPTSTFAPAPGRLTR
jgi:protein SCO1/2